MRYGWPDIIIIVAALIGAARGWEQGFVEELAGILAIVIALAAAILYPGFWDHLLVQWTHLAPDSAHVCGMALFALAAYGVVALLASLLDRYATSPIVGPFNAALGALFGMVKAVLLFWVILYIALFLPLSRALRNDLRDSFLVPLITHTDHQVDANIRPNVPWFARPFVSPYLRRHEL